MADSVRQKVVAEVERRLGTITQLNDYNTEPRLVDNAKQAKDMPDAVCVWTAMGAEAVSPDSTGFGGRQTFALEIVIGIWVKSNTTLTATTNAALQDVRNAMAKTLGNWKTATGATFAGFDECGSDAGALSADGWSVVTQVVVFTYVAGPTY